MVFDTTDATRTQFAIPVIVEAQAALRAIPAHLFLRPGQRRSVQFVRRDDGRSAKIASVSAETDRIKWSVESDSLTVWVEGTAKQAEGAAALWITDESGHRSRVLVSLME